jgi:hypothetical protein
MPSSPPWVAPMSEPKYGTLTPGGFFEQAPDRATALRWSAASGARPVQNIDGVVSTIPQAILFSEETNHQDECGGRPAHRFILSTTEGNVNLVVCSNCDHGLCECGWPLPPHAKTCPECGADVSLPLSLNIV